MKAVEWAGKFEAVPESEASIQERFAEVLKEYGIETAELVAARTKNSNEKTKFLAADGAVRDQRTKFCAVCRRVPALTESLFDLILDAAVPDYKVWKAASQKKIEESVDDVKEYRNKKRWTPSKHKGNSNATKR